ISWVIISQMTNGTSTTRVKVSVFGIFTGVSLLRRTICIPTQPIEVLRDSRFMTRTEARASAGPQHEVVLTVLEGKAAVGEYFLQAAKGTSIVEGDRGGPRRKRVDFEIPNAWNLHQPSPYLLPLLEAAKLHEIGRASCGDR